MPRRRTIRQPAQTPAVRPEDAGKVSYQTAELVDVPAVAAVFSDMVNPARVPHVRYQFSDLASLVAMIPATEPSHAICDAAWRTSNAAWSGTSTLQECFDLAATGWHDGATQAAEMAARLQIERPTKRRMTRQCQVAGALPDVARAISGNPAHMRQIAPREVAGKVVSLIVDISASCSVNENRLLLNAVCAAGIVDAMESAGFRVEVIARSIMAQGVAADVAVVAKRADEPIDLGKLAFMCGHPSVLRRLMLGLAAVEKPLHPVGENMGYPCYSVPDADRGLFVVPLPQNNLPTSDDVAEIFDGAVTALREQGCPGLDSEN